MGYTTEPEVTSEESSRPLEGVNGVRIRVLNVVMVVLAAIVSLLFLQAVQQTYETYSRFEDASVSYIQCESAASDMKEGSNYLTIQVRSFVITQNMEYLENYFWEADVNMRRQRAVETLKGLQNEESAFLEASLKDSLELMDIEYYAMKLVTEACGYDVAAIAKPVDQVVLSSDDEALSDSEKIARATDLVFGSEYMGYVERIEGNVIECKDALIEDIDLIQEESASTLHDLLRRKQILTVLLFVVIVAIIASNAVLVIWPLREYSLRIRKNEALPETGARELRYLAHAYNTMYEENVKNHDALRRKAEHDHLTGLYNRSVFEQLIEAYDGDEYALLIIDADHFKDINDTLGHDCGDAVLRKLAGFLGRAFRATDYPCRIGGDEFAVFMTEMTVDLKRVVDAKIKIVQEGMKDTSDGLPVVTLSIGVAFNDGSLEGDQVFKNADQALYAVKEAGRNGYAYYDDGVDAARE